jgi:glyoxylase-like metal-dependent hydrolase (beta-lactamase superfamily II)
VVAERFESALWRTSSLLLASGGEAVLVDPGVSSEEVDRIAARAVELGVRVTHVLATHADWDHVCGFAAFPDAVAVASEATAARIAERPAGTPVADRAAALALEIAGEPRVDRTFEPGATLDLGPFRVETMALRGHTADGVAYRFRELDVLAVGDHVSAVEFPFVLSMSEYRATLAGLADLLRRDPPDRVVPGHGPELSAVDALGIAEADLAYLWALDGAVRGAATRKEALGAANAVPLPRPAAEDLEAEGRAWNAELAVAQVFGVA